MKEIIEITDVVACIRSFKEEYDHQNILFQEEISAAFERKFVL